MEINCERGARIMVEKPGVGSYYRGPLRDGVTPAKGIAAEIE